MLTTPYQKSPLGEGGKSGPLYSFKGVDCLTFVETTLAFSLQANFKKGIDQLQKIRFHNGEINYKKRNHFMAAQWLPRNIKNGVIKEITHELFPAFELKEINKKITPGQFNHKFKKFKKLGTENLPIGTLNITYLPIEKFLKYSKKVIIPEGTIMTIVRGDQPSYPILISHLGFIVYRHGKPFYRNATYNTKHQMVRDSRLFSYIRFYYYYYKRTAWPIVGVQFFAPTTPPKK